MHLLLLFIHPRSAFSLPPILPPSVVARANIYTVHGHIGIVFAKRAWERNGKENNLKRRFRDK